MEPTPYADRIYPEAKQCFKQLSSPDNHRAGFDAATTKRQFRICMTDISEIVILPRLISGLQQQAAGVAIEAERISAASADRLESGDVDLAVGYMPTLEGGFYQQTLFRQGFVCLAAQRHPRIQESPTVRAFSSEGHSW